MGDGDCVYSPPPSVISVRFSTSYQRQVWKCISILLCTMFLTLRGTFQQGTRDLSPPYHFHENQRRKLKETAIQRIGSQEKELGERAVPCCLLENQKGAWWNRAELLKGCKEACMTQWKRMVDVGCTVGYNASIHRWQKSIQEDRHVTIKLKPPSCLLFPPPSLQS